MGIDYAREKFLVAIHSLVGAGPLSDRVYHAMVGSLIRVNPNEDLPPDSRQPFIDLKEKLTRVPAKGDEGTLQATISTLDEAELEKVAEDIVSLFYDVYTS